MRNAAIKQMDGRMLAVVSREIVAAKGHYHRSCYSLYTKADRTIDYSVKNIERAHPDSKYVEMEITAYTQLFDLIRNDLFADPDVILLNDLTKFDSLYELTWSQIIKAITISQPSTILKI